MEAEGYGAYLDQVEDPRDDSRWESRRVALQAIERIDLKVELLGKNRRGAKCCSPQERI